MSDSIFNIGLSGLNAAQTGLVTTSHNISNANTEGYSRQVVEQSANTPLFSGSGFIGQGTNVSTVKRVYSDFLNVQSLQAQASASGLNTYLAQVSQVDSLLAKSSTGVNSSLNDFFSAVNAVAANPADAASRQTLLSTARTLTDRFQSVAGNLDELRKSVNDQITGAVGSVNTLAAQIAKLNDSIALAQGRGSGTQPPNDLLDKRDTLLKQLNQQIGSTAVKDPSGVVNVYISNGQALVVGNQSFALTTVPDNNDAQNAQVALQTQTGVVRFRPEDLQGGQLGGLLAFRSESLDSAQNALGRVAIVLASAFNAQHELGQDQNGQLGGAFFSVTGPQIIPASSNTGSGAIAATITDASALTASDYRLTYNGAQYTLTRLSDNTTQSFTSFPRTVDGVTLTLSAAPNAGDSFLIEPTRAGAESINTLLTDPALIAAAAPIRASAARANIGTGTIGDPSVNTPPPPNANLQQSVTFTFHKIGATVTYDVSGTGTGNPTGIAYTPGATISYNGFSVSISGAPQEGDSFSVSANVNGVGDNRNALLLAALQTRNLVGSASGPASGTTLGSAYGALVAAVGAKTQQLQTASGAQSALLEQVSTAQQSVSGVNLDEEAANLIKYQKAYQASGKVMAIADKLFNTILSLGGS